MSEDANASLLRELCPGRPSPASKGSFLQELTLWELAAKSPNCDTVEALFGEIESIAPFWKCTEAILQWEVPNFLQVTGGADPDNEVIITALSFPGNEDHNIPVTAQGFRAYAWTELVEEVLSRDCHDVKGFLCGLLRHVGEHLQDLETEASSRFFLPSLFDELPFGSLVSARRVSILIS